MAENQVTSGSRPCACESGSIPSEKEMNRALADRCGDRLAGAFSRAVVAICGLGGLGSNIAVSLVRAGVGRLILIDFDKVDMNNLNRQQYKADQIGMDKTEALSANLREINPYVSLTAHDLRLTAENAALLLEQADIICEAFDDPSAYLVAASGMAGIASANDIKTRRISERFYLCGDGVSDSAEKPGLLSARVALCAAHQAHMVLRLLAGFKEP